MKKPNQDSLGLLLVKVRQFLDEKTLAQKIVRGFKDFSNEELVNVLYYEVALQDDIALEAIKKNRPDLYRLLKKRKEFSPEYAYSVMTIYCDRYVIQHRSRRKVRSHLRSLLLAELNNKRK